MDEDDQKRVDGRENRIWSIDRDRGAMLDLAVGDTVGSSLEFDPRVASSIERRETAGGGSFDLPTSAEPTTHRCE